MRLFLALAGALLLPAAAHAQLCCGHAHRARAVMLVAPVQAAAMPTAAVGYTAAYSMPYTVAAPSCTGSVGYAPGYSYAQPVQITSLSYAQPVAAPVVSPFAAAPSPGPGDVNDKLLRLTEALGKLTAIVGTHTDVLSQHEASLRAIHERTTALERRTAVPPMPTLPVPK